MEIFKIEDGKVIITVPGYLTVDEDGHEVVTYPPPERIFGSEPEDWPSQCSARAVVHLDKDQFREGVSHQLEQQKDKIAWWINTSNHNVRRAEAAEAKVDEARKFIGSVFLPRIEELAKDQDASEGLVDVAFRLARLLDTPFEPPPEGDRDVNVRGDWMQTSTGVFWPLQPKPEDINIYDIARGLGRQCRFAGQLSDFYSVAQHSVLASHIVPPCDALWALMHDAAEAYIGDMVRPLKHSAMGEAFRRVEANIMRCVCERFELPYEQPASVTDADLRLLGTERRDLMRDPPCPWRHIGEPLGERITPWTPGVAVCNFLDRAQELGIQLQ